MYIWFRPFHKLQIITICVCVCSAIWCVIYHFETWSVNGVYVYTIQFTRVPKLQSLLNRSRFIPVSYRILFLRTWILSIFIWKMSTRRLQTPIYIIIFWSFYEKYVSSCSSLDLSLIVTTAAYDEFNNNSVRNHKNNKYTPTLDVGFDLTSSLPVATVLAPFRRWRGANT